jgi:hypothetical protein
MTPQTGCSPADELQFYEHCIIGVGDEKVYVNQTL